MNVRVLLMHPVPTGSRHWVNVSHELPAPTPNPTSRVRAQAAKPHAVAQPSVSVVERSGFATTPPGGTSGLSPALDPRARSEGKPSTSGRCSTTSSSSSSAATAGGRRSSTRTRSTRKLKLPRASSWLSRESSWDSPPVQPSFRSSCKHIGAPTYSLTNTHSSSSSSNKLVVLQGQVPYAPVIWQDLAISPPAVPQLALGGPAAGVAADASGRSLTNQLTAAATVTEVQQLLAVACAGSSNRLNPLSPLNHYHVSTALWRLAHLVSKDPPAAVAAGGATARGAGAAAAGRPEGHLAGAAEEGMAGSSTGSSSRTVADALSGLLVQLERQSKELMAAAAAVAAAAAGEASASEAQGLLGSDARHQTTRSGSGSDGRGSNGSSSSSEGSSSSSRLAGDQLLREATPRQLSESIWALATLGHSPGDPWWLHFWQVTALQLGKYSAQQLAVTAWAAGKLGAVPPPAWQQGFEEASYRTLRWLKPQELCMLLWGLVQWGWRPSGSWWSRMEVEVEREKGCVEPRDVTQVIWAASRLGAALSPRWLTSMVAVAQGQALPRFRGRDVAVLSWALVSQPGCSRDLLGQWLTTATAMLQRSNVKLRGCSSQDYATLLWCFASRNLNPPGSWAVLTWRSTHPSSCTLNPADAAMLVWSGSKLGLHPGLQWLHQLWQQQLLPGRQQQQWRAAAATAGGSQRHFPAPLPLGVSPGDTLGDTWCLRSVVITTWAAVQLGSPPPSPWLSTMLGRLQQQLEDLEPAVACQLLAVLARCRYSPSVPFMAQLLARLQLDLHELEPKGFACVFWALGVLRFRPAKTWWDSMEVHLVRAVEGMGPRELLNVAWGMASLGWVPLEAVLGALGSKTTQLLVAELQQEAVLLQLQQQQQQQVTERYGQQEDVRSQQQGQQQGQQQQQEGPPTTGAPLGVVGGALGRVYQEEGLVWTGWKQQLIGLLVGRLGWRPRLGAGVKAQMRALLVQLVVGYSGQRGAVTATGSSGGSSSSGRDGDGARPPGAVAAEWLAVTAACKVEVGAELQEGCMAWAVRLCEEGRSAEGVAVVAGVARLMSGRGSRRRGPAAAAATAAAARKGSNGAESSSSSSRGVGASAWLLRVSRALKPRLGGLRARELQQLLLALLRWPAGARAAVASEEEWQGFLMALIVAADGLDAAELGGSAVGSICVLLEALVASAGAQSAGLG